MYPFIWFSIVTVISCVHMSNLADTTGAFFRLVVLHGGRLHVTSGMKEPDSIHIQTWAIEPVACMSIVNLLLCGNLEVLVGVSNASIVLESVSNAYIMLFVKFNQSG